MKGQDHPVAETRPELLGQLEPQGDARGVKSPLVHAARCLKNLGFALGVNGQHLHGRGGCAGLHYRSD